MSENVQAVRGISVVWLFRLIEDEATQSAFNVGFQTEGEQTETAEADSVITKDGTIRNPSQLESEGSMTAIFSRNDPNEKKLRKALRQGKRVGFWEIDRANQNSDGKYEATYYEGYMTERSKGFTSEDLVEISYSFALEGEGVDGWATLSEELAKVVNYVFKDTTPVTVPGA